MTEANVLHLGLPDGGTVSEPKSNGHKNYDGANKPDSKWPEPEPIKAELSGVEPFPFEILPEPLEGWIRDVAYRMQCPPDFIAVAALTLIGSVIGTRCGIRPKQHDDWLVLPNLWGGVVARPSMLKTPALKEALRPLARLEAEAKEAFDKNVNGHEVDLLEYQARKEGLKKEMGKTASGRGDRDMADIKEAFVQLEAPESPTIHRYKTNDTTIEKLSELLNENPDGLLLFRDELVGLLTSWEKPGRESDRAFFLEAWDGAGSHTTDRIGRGTIFTENLCLSVFGGIQPSKLTGYLLQSMSGLENDGLVQRIQMLVYPDEIKDWELIDQTPDKAARERAFRIIQRLAEMDFERIGATREGGDGFPFLRFSDEAQQVFNDWLTDLQLDKLQADDHPVIIEHLAKYRSLMPTLALIFHIINMADGAEEGPVSVGAAEKAAAWCDFLEGHARRVYGLVVDVNQRAAVALAGKIQEGKLADGFTGRDVYRHGWHLLNSKELAKAACDELVDAGWLRVERAEDQREGRPALPAYSINPKVKKV